MEDTGTKNGRNVSKRVTRGTRGKGGNESSFLKENAALIAQLKEAKIEHYKSEKVEIKFSPLAFLPESVLDPKSETQQEDIEDLLYYSAGPRG